MNLLEGYERWLKFPEMNQSLKDQLLAIKDNPKEIEDRFYKALSFGTGGLRGLLGAGTNRMNIYTVGGATQGLANYLLKNPSKGAKGVAIAYDSRHFSETFALEAALVLAGNGILVYLFDDLRPTPELSFAVRKLGCEAGIVITASHNPAEYNGYKVYGEDGGQITEEMAGAIIGEISEINIFKDIRRASEEDAKEAGLLNIIGETIDQAYLDQVAELSLRKDLAAKVPDFKIVYTPLHGSGLMLVSRALKQLGYENVTVVEEQKKPDGAFPTVKSPNPEEREAFSLGIQLAESIEGDLLIGTDPDGDRVGVVVRTLTGDYQIMTGNQIGALLANYILTSKEEVTEKDAIINTVVTSDLGTEIAKSFGAYVFTTLTGFKYIGEKIKEFEATGSHAFAFGYEESYGYLAGTFVRDKDGVIASALIVEMAAYYHSIGLTLLDALEAIYMKFGYYTEALDSYVFKGKDGADKIQRTVEKFRNYELLAEQISDIDYIEDYDNHTKTFLDGRSTETITLPKSNVIKVYFKNKAWFAIRPSGTEPKLKIYFSIVSHSKSTGELSMKALKELVKTFIG